VRCRSEQKHQYRTTAFGKKSETAVEGMKIGAFDYIKTLIMRNYSTIDKAVV
jgi:hypothetical protein